MATTIWLRKTKTVPSALPTAAQRDMTVANVATAAATVAMPTGSSTAAPEFQLQVTATDPGPAHFWSERIAAEVTISGTVTVLLRAFTTTGGTVRLRAKLWKITAGGSNIETFIGQGDSTANLTTASASYTFTFTPAAGVTVVANERFIVRLYAIPDPTTGLYGTPSSNFAVVSYSSGASTGNCSITFTETVTFIDNGIVLAMRDTTANGIGSFMDLIPTFGASLQTAIVNTAAGGTDIVWTKTAGGVTAEWISPRINNLGWTPLGTANFLGSARVSSSNTLSNAMFRARIFRRRPDGTETLLYTRTDAVILSAAGPAPHPWTNAASGTDTFVSGVSFQEDDRLIVRCYITNNGTMAAGYTASLDYNNTTINNSSYLQILDAPFFKLESDPAGTARIPGGLTMGGVGN